ncbi:uncharacterized protein LOC125019512 [Mugil cephalus]|uniref:uncharacterized protein LOC125019512 n=1 Tax=Mugil cephalus TaxID=48193 RepID=UPI001FB6F36D|nr:uncharacterized protein LOC125019512 [Mugil cephalus]
MSGPPGVAPPAAVLGLGLDVGGGRPWHQRSRALVQTYLLSGSGSRAAKPPLRLPSLVAAAKGSHRRGSMARLSLSEPSLLTPNENLPSEGFSTSRRSSLFQKRPPPPAPLSLFKACHPPGTGPSHQQPVQSFNKPTYIHFSQAIQPISKPRPVRRHSHNPSLSSEMVSGDLRPSAAHRNSLSQVEPLSVVGKTCLLSCSQRPAAAGPARTHLHVFLPSEAEGEEADSESVDEGFMDELDSKMTSLRVQQRATNTHKYHSESKQMNPLL